MQPRIVAVCLALGVATEAIAVALGWWVYDPWWLRVVNVVAVFGGVFGWLTSRLALASWWARFAAGAAFGIVYEAVNLEVLGWWTFPGERLLILRGTPGLVLGVGLAWGVVPALAALVVNRHQSIR